MADRSQRGFTLIELVSAVAPGALLLVALASVQQQGRLRTIDLRSLSAAREARLEITLAGQRARDQERRGDRRHRGQWQAAGDR